MTLKPTSAENWSNESNDAPDGTMHARETQTAAAAWGASDQNARLLIGGGRGFRNVNKIGIEYELKLITNMSKAFHLVTNTFIMFKTTCLFSVLFLVL